MQSPDIIRIALLQLPVTKDKAKNVDHAIAKIRQVVQQYRPRLVALPECFDCPYGNKYFADFAESIPNGYTCNRLSKLAAELNIYIVGGSIIERDAGGHLYNTSTVWSPKGELIGKHRKIHLYNLNITGKFSFAENETLTPGNDITIVNIDNHSVGIIICHDCRFEEMIRVYRERGIEMLIIPSSFDTITGAMHWELLARSRANDNQIFVATISGARDESADYVSWGHSMIVDPWGKVIKVAREYEDIIVAEIDFRTVQEVRKQIPIHSQRRTDLYSITSNKCSFRY